MKASRRRRKQNSIASTCAIVSVEQLEQRSLLSVSPVMLPMVTDNVIAGERVHQLAWTRPDSAVTFELRMTLDGDAVLDESGVLETSFNVPRTVPEGSYVVGRPEYVLVAATG